MFVRFCTPYEVLRTAFWHAGLNPAAHNRPWPTASPDLTGKPIFNADASPLYSPDSTDHATAMAKQEMAYRSSTVGVSGGK